MSKIESQVALKEKVDTTEISDSNELLLNSKNRSVQSEKYINFFAVVVLASMKC